MSNVAAPPKRHRATRSAAMPPAAASPQHPQNPHLLNMQANSQNSQAFYTLPPTTPPRTPRRVDPSHSVSQNIPSSTTGDSGSKQRSRNKNRPKNVVTSPAVTRNGRNTPPLTGAQSAGIPTSAKPISTPSTAAYAGPTFHASPAPSALPIPSFYSKSVPDSPGIKGIKALRDGSPNGAASSPVATTQATSNQFHREESPLDFFFKADREEKARARSASSTVNSTTATGPFPPPPESPHGSHTPSSASQNRTRDRNSSNGIFAMEMESPSSPGTPYGPAFSTPYSERINAARASTTPSRPWNNTAQNSHQSVDRSEALKAYLFSGRPLQDPVSQNNAPHEVPIPASPLGPFTSTSYRNTPNSRSHINNFAPTHDCKTSSARTLGRSSGLRQEVSPTKTPTKTPDRNSNYATSPTPSRRIGKTSTPTNDFMGNFNSHSNSPTLNSPFGVPSGTRSADLQGMEDSLRKILKLDPAGSSGVTGSNIGGVTGSAVSIPSYVGGHMSS